MRIAVLNYSGSVGKTTVSSHLLAPRLLGADLIAVESTNETAADLGLDIEQLRGEQFGLLFRKLLATDDAIVDVGASNAEDFLSYMVKYDASHEEIDQFVLPVIASGKAQRETIKTIQTLEAIGVGPDRIRVLFNRVLVDAQDEFSAIFGYALVEKNFRVNPGAAIYENEVFDLLSTRRTTIAEVLRDETDYRQLLREIDKEDTDTLSRYTDLLTLRALARPVHRQLDAAYAALLA